jgi:predicted DNA-binding transcriptional regulator AlpA
MSRKAGGPFVPRKVRIKKIVVSDPTLTVAEFCDAEGIGRSTYCKLRKEGRGPRELRIGATIRITAEARKEWRKKMVKESESA